MNPRARRVLSAIVAAMQSLCLIGVALTLADCGGSSNSSSSSTTTTDYTVGGTITGLTMGSVVLANGSSTVTVSANATTWVFPTTFTAGSSYSVTVQTQPAQEQCAVTSNGSGKDTGDVGNVTVVCGFGQWNWKDGSNTVNASGVYGTQAIAAAGNVPGGRFSGSSWTDSAGNFWLFGGAGYDSSANTGYLNDLWRYSASTAQWTWISGSSSANASGTYGTQGTAASGNVPGARYGASHWLDASGNLWLFGGYGYDSAGTAGYLNDLWQYSVSSGQWTWVSGASTAGASGLYGTKGTASSSNAPGGRKLANAWLDASGNLWLFGGYGDDSSGATGNLNDLWRYSPKTGQWTWINGSNAVNGSASYGTQGTAASSNVPGARYAATAWVDGSGNLWLFGGYGEDSAATLGKLNDLWRFDVTSTQWTWISGEEIADAPGIYGTLGTASATTLPGARQAANSWIDSSGNLWLFGGTGFDATGGVGNLNDAWQYSPSTLQWTWVSGASRINSSGIYGTQGSASAVNAPGARNSISSWIDSSGNLWLFGGSGYDSAGNLGYLNDLWQYNPSSGS